MARRYRKDDIEYHGTHYQYDAAPAVNVKVHTDLRDGWRQFEEYRAAEGYDPAFTPEWLAAYAAREHLADEWLDEWWQAACNNQREAADCDLEYFFAKAPVRLPAGAQCWLTGRAGGWLYVGDARGRPLWMREEVEEEWDAIAVAAWGRFEKACKAYAAEVPYQTLDLIYYNVFEPQREREEAIVREMVA